MEPTPKRQSNKQSNETASAASKTAASRKQSGNEPSTAATQGSAPSPGTSGNQGMTGTQGSTGTPGTTGTQSTSGTQSAAHQGGGEQDLLQHAKQASGNIVSKVQEQAGSQFARQKESAANELTQVVDAVRRFGQSLQGEQSGPIARYAAQYGDKAAQSLERFSTYIRDKEPQQLLNDVQNFGRRRPALLLGGAFLLGFAGARLIKTSMDAKMHTSMDDTRSELAIQPNVPASRPSTMPNAI